MRWRPFPNALEYTRSLRLRKRADWYAWSKSGGRPKDIPSNPNVVYASAGWVSWGHYLGHEEDAQVVR